MVFPHSDAGKRAAEHALKDVLREERGKEARRAQLLVYAFEGELTVKALEALGNRSLMSLAGIVGLSAFKHLKGLQGKDRTKAVIEGVKKFRKTTNSPETLKAAKALVKAWETEVKATNAEEIANAKSVSEKVTAMRKQDEAVNGRSLTDGSIPTGPKTGDLIVDADSFWYRIVGVGAIKGLFLAEHMSKKEIRKTFSGLKFQRLSSRKNTPVWSGGVGGAAPK
jgi:hypothetical protein